jgi:hypothetical protein
MNYDELKSGLSEILSTHLSAETEEETHEKPQSA